MLLGLLLGLLGVLDDPIPVEPEPMLPEPLVLPDPVVLPEPLVLPEPVVLPEPLVLLPELPPY